MNALPSTAATVAAVPLVQIRQEMLRTAVRAGTSFNPVAVLGDWADWRQQAEAEYTVLFAALPMLKQPGKASAALSGADGNEVLQDLGVALAGVRERARWLAGLADAAARQIGAILAARPDGNAAALAVLAALLAGHPESTGDDRIVQAAADAERLERLHMECEEAADTFADDSAESAACRADADRAGKDRRRKLCEVASTPASGRAGEVAKARLLFDLVSTGADGKPPANAYPDQLLAFSLVSDILHSAGEA